MFFTESDIPSLSQQLRYELGLDFAIQAKKDLQNQLFIQATQMEALALAQNTVPDSLLSKLMSITRTYLSRLTKSPVEVYAIALAAGTIIKELDNGNTAHVTNSAIAKLMNEIV